MPKIPPALIGTAAEALSVAYTHSQLDSLFHSAGFPGEPPDGNKLHKCQVWLRRANTEVDDPLLLFGHLVAEFLETEPTQRDWSPFLGNIEIADPRAPLQAAMSRCGLSYLSGGFILGAHLAGPSKSLGDRLKIEGIDAVETEYRRAYLQIEADPPAAITAACAILEAVCKAYLIAEKVELPSKQVLGPLWAAASAHLGLSAKVVEVDDLKQILSGLSSIAVGVAALRTHSGSAHGHAAPSENTEGKRYRIGARHARLAVHAAHTMALFVLETWEARKAADERAAE